MNCEEISDQLSAYIDGELGAEENRLVGSHLDECAECRAKLTALESTVKMVRGLGKLEVPAEVSLSLRKITNTGNGKAVPINRRSMLPRLQYLVATLAVAVIALVAIVLQTDMGTLNKNPEQGMPSGKNPAGPELGRTKIMPKDVESNGRPSNGTLASTPPIFGNAAGNNQIASQDITSKAGPWPEVVSTQKNYDSKAADTLLADIKKKTDGLYTVNDARQLRADVMNTVVDGINKININGELMRGPINSLLDQTKRSALPVYVEKAKFNKQDCWIVVIRWGFGGVKSNLYRASVYVTDLWFKSTLYYASS